MACGDLLGRSQDPKLEESVYRLLGEMGMKNYSPGGWRTERELWEGNGFVLNSDGEWVTLDLINLEERLHKIQQLIESTRTPDDIQCDLEIVRVEIKEIRNEKPALGNQAEWDRWDRRFEQAAQREATLSRCLKESQSARAELRAVLKEISVSREELRKKIGINGLPIGISVTK